MKKFLPTLACGIFLAAGIAQAQVVVRVAPPERPVEVSRRHPMSIPIGPGTRAIIAGTVTPTSGFPEPTSSHPTLTPTGLMDIGITTVKATSGLKVTGASPDHMPWRPRRTVRQGIIPDRGIILK